jgi:hypothetical protein
MDPSEFKSKVKAVRMMAGSNQFTIDGCGWLAEICQIARSSYERIESQDEYDHKDSDFGPFK